MSPGFNAASPSNEPAPLREEKGEVSNHPFV